MVFEELVRPDQPARYPTHPLAERCGNGPLRIAGLERGFMARNVVIRRYGDRCRIPRKLRRSAELSDHSHARCQWYKSLLGAAGMTEFEYTGELLEQFPFLRDDPNYDRQTTCLNSRH